MRISKGKKIVEGISAGKLRLYRPSEYVIEEGRAENPDIELNRFESARKLVKKQQRQLYEEAVRKAGEKSAEIFSSHELILDDGKLVDGCKEIILEQKCSAQYAVNHVFENTVKMFLEMDDPYFRSRSADVTELKNAMLKALSKNDREGDLACDPEGEPYILVADDLTPSELMRLHKSKLIGLVLREGSVYSHTAILAGSLNLPTIIQCKDIDDDWDDRFGILSGYDSCVYIEPDQELIDSLNVKQNEDQKKEALLQELKGKANITLDGRTIKVYANIGGLSDVEAVQLNDAEGVGLFRSEFVYMDSKADPTEEEQFVIYKDVLEKLSPKRVTIRTCDIGADKNIDYMNLDREENPALGYRAIRICLSRIDFFKRQLRAILRASVYGNPGIMFPMITSLGEVRKCKEILDECKRELADEGRSVGKTELGIMIETPAAALCADELAQEVDFFSIGTNDLTQYTCAIDRQNAKLGDYIDPHHPAVLKLVGMTLEAGHRHGIRVGICGELAADLSLTETFLKMGIDELSVNPGRVLPLRERIRSIDLSSD